MFHYIKEDYKKSFNYFIPRLAKDIYDSSHYLIEQVVK